MACSELIPSEDKATSAQIHHYQQKVGSILYATVISRPDAARTVNKLAEFLTNLAEKHLEAADRAIAYLYATRYLAIEYSGMTDPNETFICASDASFADHKDWKSTEGYLCKLYGGPIDWRASKQRTVTTSTTEAELLAISEAAKSTFWWKRLFEAVDFDPEHQISILRCVLSFDMLIYMANGFAKKFRQSTLISDVFPVRTCPRWPDEGPTRPKTPRIHEDAWFSQCEKPHYGLNGHPRTQLIFQPIKTVHDLADAGGVCRPLVTASIPLQRRTYR
jgi:hypothetical protein